MKTFLPTLSMLIVSVWLLPPGCARAQSVSEIELECPRGEHVVLEIPPGTHTLRGALLDSEGRSIGGAEIRLVRFETASGIESESVTAKDLGAGRGVMVLEKIELVTHSDGSFSAGLRPGAVALQLDWEQRVDETVTWRLMVSSREGR